MKFQTSITINAPRDKVVALWQDPELLVHWQDGYQKSEHISGEAGKPGAKTRMLYDMRGNEMELIETVKINDLPHEFMATYHHKNMTNTMHSRFVENDDGTTTWLAEFDYTLMKGFIIKLIAKVYPALFRKQTEKWNKQFKRFVEARN